MENKDRKTIAFLTGPWTNVDKNIREGKAPGGVPSISRAWTTCLEHGWKVHVFIQTMLEADWPKETVELGGIKFHWVRPAFPRLTQWLAGHQFSGQCKIFWLIAQMKLVRRIRASKIKPDIIYCMRSTFALLGFLWSRKVKAKCVLRWYGTFLYDIWFKQKKWLPRIKSLGPLLLFKIPFDLLIMTNDGTRGDKVAKWAGFNMDRCWFPINGVNKFLYIEGFDKKSFKEKIGLDAECPLFMTLGRLTYWKRLDRPIDAMPKILKEYPDAKLLIVGSGELKDSLEERVRKLGLEKSVKFMGAVTHEEIKYYLNSSDLFIMPNDVTNMCSTLIEGLTSRCCVVTRDVGSTTEIVTHDENAIVLKPGEADEFADAILELLRDPDKRKRLSTQAYKGAMERFTTWEERMEMEFEKLSGLLKAKNDSDLDH